MSGGWELRCRGELLFAPTNSARCPLPRQSRTGVLSRAAVKWATWAARTSTLRLSTFRKTVPSTVIYEVDQQPVEGEMDVPSGDVRARSPGLNGGGDERSGNLPRVRTAPGHGTQDADLLGAIRLPVPQI